MKISLTVAVLLSMLLAISSADADEPRVVFTSKTALTPEQEVQNQPVVSDGEAAAMITFDRRYRNADIRVTFSNLEGNVSRLHLHCNVAGANGPIAIGLIDLVALGNDNSETVTLGANTFIGSLRNKQFPDTDACAGALGRPIGNLRELAHAINDGLIYWNLHTFAFPAGELRGQVEPLTRTRLQRAYRDDD